MNIISFKRDRAQNILGVRRIWPVNMFSRTIVFKCNSTILFLSLDALRENNQNPGKLLEKFRVNCEKIQKFRNKLVIFLGFERAFLWNF